jgi:hypothetical protein
VIVWVTRALAVLLLAAACGAGAATPLARAHDSLAPPGALHTWLPKEGWVKRHWLPFDERQLTKRLDIGERELEGYLYDDHRPLADLATARGIDLARLSDELMAPWGLAASDPKYALLRDRTVRILTQPHLAQHVFFHVYHGHMVAHDPQRAFGFPDLATVRALRHSGLTAIEIAQRGGVSTAQLRATLLEYFRDEADAGVHSGLAWPAESGRILARQIASLDCWMRRPIPGRDPSNPYGKALQWHGNHRAGWPATAAQRRADERRVERVRRALRRGCWRRPGPWSWAAHGLTPP